MFGAIYAQYLGHILLILPHKNLARESTLICHEIAHPFTLLVGSCETQQSSLHIYQSIVVLWLGRFHFLTDSQLLGVAVREGVNGLDINPRYYSQVVQLLVHHPQHCSSIPTGEKSHAYIHRLS